MPPVIVIGAGHNGLAAAFYLAKAGLQPLVIEARGEVGGGAITRELHPGFRCPTLTHETLLHERVVRDMSLRRHGLTFVAGDVERCALRTAGPPLVIHRDAAHTATELARRSPLDVERFLDFAVTLRRYGSVIAPLLDTPSPRRRGGRLRDQLTWLTAARRFRALGTRDAHRLLQWIAMPIADLVEDAFGDELMQAAIAAPPLIGTRLGPRSGGTTFLLLLREAHRQLAGDGGRLAIGGPGALTTTMSRAATEAGARIELNVPVERILVEGGRVRGVIAGGRDHAADVVVSAIDPKTTWWLAGQPEIDPAMSHGMRHYRTGGTLAKINLALAALPSFTGVDADRAALTGRIQVGPTIEFLERAFDPAKYGGMSPEPWLDICLPSLSDSSLAPHGAHVASIYAHYVPRDLRSADWSDTANVLLQTVMDTLERYAPGVSSLVVAAEVITPRMLQREYGYAGGHVFHGEMTLDQMFGMRPVFGYGHYRTPVDGLYLCSAGTHPGGFMTGASGRLAAIQLIRDLKGI